MNRHEQNLPFIFKWLELLDSSTVMHLAYYEKWISVGDLVIAATEALDEVLDG